MEAFGAITPVASSEVTTTSVPVVKWGKPIRLGSMYNVAQPYPWYGTESPSTW